MKTNRILTYEEVKSKKSGNSKEKLVDVRLYDMSIIATYEKFDMVPYTGTTILIRETVARKLALANQRLKDWYKLKLKVAYGYRSPSVQESYFEKKAKEIASLNPSLSEAKVARLTHNFIAVPDVAGHVTGGALDLTLVSLEGVACDMGTGIADFSDEDRIKTYSTKVTSNQKKLRLILLQEMVAVGFAPFLGEWWHFSYGDKEWAAWYDQPKALYGPINIPKSATLYKIAGGNETVLQPLRRIKDISNEQLGNQLLRVYPNAEQAGLVYADDMRLEMAGGEFCGNASAAAAVMLLKESPTEQFEFTSSGFKNSIMAKVTPTGDMVYCVELSFKNMTAEIKVRNSVYKGRQYKIVDMKGIVHILIESDFPRLRYNSLVRDIIKDLGLADRDAVGVIWYKRQKKKVYINPVVWVKNLNTLYYESACGSGSIAAAICTNINKIIQPTGEDITVAIEGNRITTTSIVEVYRT